ncbi:MAG: extracellular solute-binding protein [Anaerolineales bacterium]|nr:extracellular solute-binding protein [Anaerolineales bacterium]
MKKHLLVLLSLLVVASMALAACGAPAEEVPATEAAATEAATEVATEAPAEPVTITFWEQEGEEVDVFIDQLIADFQAANPNITVERTHYENEALRDQFQTASLAEAAPDVVRVPSDFAGPFSTLQIVAPVDQLFDQAFLDQSFEGALENSKVAGTYWGIP